MVKIRKSNAANAIQAILEEDDAYSQLLVERLINSLVNTVKQNSSLAYEICKGFENNFADVMEFFDIEFPTNPDLDKDGSKKPRYKGISSGRAVREEDWNAIKKFSTGQVDCADLPNPNTFSANVKKLGEHLKLSEIETDCLVYINAIQCVDPSYLNFIADLLKSHPERFSAFLSLGMGRPEEFKQISEIVSPIGRLAKYGIIDFEETMIEGVALPQIDPDIRDALNEKNFNHSALIEKIIGRPIKKTLTIDKNFPHLSVEAKRIARVLKKAAAEGIKGVNVLIYGPVGSGKTELAHAIAHEAGLTAYAVGEDDDSNYNDYGDGQKLVDSQKRLQKFKQAQKLLEDTGCSLTILDEIEDLLIKGTDTDKKADTGSKIEINNVLTENKVPAILIGNDADKFHASFHSRIKLPLYVGYQPTLVRKKIWDHHIRKNKLKLPLGSRLKLARSFEAPPRVIAHACETAAIMDGKIETIIAQIGHKSTLSFKGIRTGYDVVSPVPEFYSTKFISPSMDIDLLSQMVTNAANDQQALSVIIEGEEGTGKSTLASYLAEQAMRHVAFEDMEEMIVPTAQTEPVHHIAIAFAKAARMEAVLVIENTETLFANTTHEPDRDKMIRQIMEEMETHKQPVIFIQSSDSNMSEVFRAYADVSVSLGKLRGEQLASAYKKYTGLPCSQSGVSRSIGDIARAAKSVRILHGGDTASDVIERRIAATSAAKSSPIGLHRK